MKTYKHKFSGNIAQEINSSENYIVTEPQNFTIPKWIVEEGGDWEEVKVAPEYEVTKIQLNISDIILTFQGEKCIHRSDDSTWPTFNLSRCLMQNNYEIISIRRLSDGQEFSIGDKIKDSLTDITTDYKVQVINYFARGVRPDGIEYFAVCFESGTTAGLGSIYHCEKS